MFFKLLLLFTLGPLLEIYVLLEIGKLIGTLETIALVVLTGIAGAALAKTQGFIILQRIRFELTQGELPGDELINGLCVLIGGAFLVTPGLISDVIGFFLILPVTRDVIKSFLKRKIERMLHEGTFRIWWK